MSKPIHYWTTFWRTLSEVRFLVHFNFTWCFRCRRVAMPSGPMHVEQSNQTAATENPAMSRCNNRLIEISKILNKKETSDNWQWQQLEPTFAVRCTLTEHEHRSSKPTPIHVSEQAVLGRSPCTIQCNSKKKTAPHKTLSIFLSNCAQSQLHKEASVHTLSLASWQRRAICSCVVLTCFLFVAVLTLSNFDANFTSHRFCSNTSFQDAEHFTSMPAQFKSLNSKSLQMRCHFAWFARAHASKSFHVHALWMLPLRQALFECWTVCSNLLQRWWHSSAWQKRDFVNEHQICTALIHLLMCHLKPPNARKNGQIMAFSWNCAAQQQNLLFCLEHSNLAKHSGNFSILSQRQFFLLWVWHLQSLQHWPCFQMLHKSSNEWPFSKSAVGQWNGKTRMVMEFCKPVMQSFEFFGQNSNFPCNKKTQWKQKVVKSLKSCAATKSETDQTLTAEGCFLHWLKGGIQPHFNCCCTSHCFCSFFNQLLGKTLCFFNCNLCVWLGKFLQLAKMTWVTEFILSFVLSFQRQTFLILGVQRQALSQLKSKTVSQQTGNRFACSPTENFDWNFSQLLVDPSIKKWVWNFKNRLPTCFQFQCSGAKFWLSLSVCCSPNWKTRVSVFTSPLSFENFTKCCHKTRQTDFHLVCTQTCILAESAATPCSWLPSLSWPWTVVQLGPQVFNVAAGIFNWKSSKLGNWELRTETQANEKQKPSSSVDQRLWLCSHSQWSSTVCGTNQTPTPWCLVPAITCYYW